MKKRNVILALLLPVAGAVVGDYWNSRTHLMPMRLPLPDGSVEYIDINGDGKVDGLKATVNGTPVLWLDDDGNMRKGDIEGDQVNDCLLIDRNRDGKYGSYGDIIIDWVDSDGDGHADYQFVLDYPAEGQEKTWGQGHYMIVADMDRDNVFNYINFNNFTIQAWDHQRLSEFYLDYAGQTAFMKVHRPTTALSDLRVNWENPFLFYDPDNDGLSEMAIRVVDTPQNGTADWISVAVDLDNDNAPGNDFDFDFTLGFQGAKAFDYSDQRHPINMGGLAEADTFFVDPRYRHLTELVYPDHKAAPEMIFKRGNWKRINFVYDEDDDCNRWERVEFYDPAEDPFVVGWKNGGIDNNKQSDPAGDRGEWDMDASGGGKLYISRFDGRLHLYGAERGVWRIDQNGQYYQGWDRDWMGYRDPKSMATVVYTDTDKNGFFDHIEYDLNGDREMETVVDFGNLGIDDVCDLIDVSAFKYEDYNKMFKQLSKQMWERGRKATEIARQYGMPTGWYSRWMNPRSDRERYEYGYWLAFYIYNDLLQLTGDERMTRAYYSGDWDVAATDCFAFFTPDEVATIRRNAKTEYGKQIVSDLRKKVDERRRHSLVVPIEEGGHYHHYFCPKHNMELTFDWDSPKAHLCEACGFKHEGNNSYDWAWIHKVHMVNREYMYDCMWLWLATGEKKYSAYVRDMLLDYASKYPGWQEHDANRKQTYTHSGKAFAQSLDEASWSTKVAMVYGVMKDSFTAKQRKAIEDGLLRPCATLLLNRDADANWQMWYNGGLSALGVALGDDRIIDTAINKPRKGYRDLLVRFKNADGWIDEGSAHYHYYPLEALLFTANAVRCRGIDLFDEAMRDMFVMPVLSTYPDMSFPAHSDGWYGANLLAQTPLYELAYANMPDATIRSTLQRAYSYKPRLDPEALLVSETITPDSTAVRRGSINYPDAGYCVMRVGDYTLVYKYSGNAGGHAHPDRLSFTLHDGERELMSDFGTTGYMTPDYRGWYQRTLAHSTVTVDGRNQALGRSRLLRYDCRKEYALADAESSELYPGVKMRRALRLEADGSVADKYDCRSRDEHLYEYVLLLNDSVAGQGGRAVTEPVSSDEAWQRIHGCTAYDYAPGMTLTAGALALTFSVDGGTVEQVITGCAPGAPSNPTISEGAASERAAARNCYPVVLRVRGKDITINTQIKPI